MNQPYISPYVTITEKKKKNRMGVGTVGASVAVAGAILVTQPNVSAFAAEQVVTLATEPAKVIPNVKEQVVHHIVNSTVPKKVMEVVAPEALEKVTKENNSALIDKKIEKIQEAVEKEPKIISEINPKVSEATINKTAEKPKEEAAPEKTEAVEKPTEETKEATKEQTKEVPKTEVQKKVEVKKPVQGEFNEQFQYWQLALDASHQTGWSPLLIMSQWQIETSHFTSNVFKENNNMGGMTWTPSSKFSKGTPRPVNEGGHYIKYPKNFASHIGYIEFIQANGRYDEVKTLKTPEEQAHAVAFSGWAGTNETDYSNYETLLKKLIAQNRETFGDVAVQTDNPGIVDEKSGEIIKQEKSIAQKIVTEAYRMLETRGVNSSNPIKYSMPQRNSEAFGDCSEFTMNVLKQSLDTYIGFTTIEQIEKNADKFYTDITQLQPGDLVYFNSPGGHEHARNINGNSISVDHTGIYVGDGKMIDLSYGVGYISLKDVGPGGKFENYFNSSFIGFVRMDETIKVNTEDKNETKVEVVEEKTNESKPSTEKIDNKEVKNEEKEKEKETSKPENKEEKTTEAKEDSKKTTDKEENNKEVTKEEPSTDEPKKDEAKPQEEKTEEVNPESAEKEPSKEETESKEPSNDKEKEVSEEQPEEQPKEEVKETPKETKEENSSESETTDKQSEEKTSDKEVVVEEGESSSDVPFIMEQIFH